MYSNPSDPLYSPILGFLLHLGKVFEERFIKIKYILTVQNFTARQDLIILQKMSREYSVRIVQPTLAP